MHIKKLKQNPSNPRHIKDKGFYSLVKKVLSLPSGLTANRIAYVTNGVKHDGKLIEGTFVLSGNQRHKALEYIANTQLSEIEKATADDGSFWKRFWLNKALVQLWEKYQETKTLPSAWVQDVTHLNEQERAELIIVTNVSDGYWNYDALAADWDYDQLKSWGVDIDFKPEDIDLEQFFMDTVPNGMAGVDGKIKLVLQYTAEDHALVMEAFKQHKGTNEEIVFKLLGL